MRDKQNVGIPGTTCPEACHPRRKASTVGHHSIDVLDPFFPRAGRAAGFGDIVAGQVDSEVGGIVVRAEGGDAQVHAALRSDEINPSCRKGATSEIVVQDRPGIVIAVQEPDAGIGGGSGNEIGSRGADVKAGRVIRAIIVNLQDMGFHIGSAQVNDGLSMVPGYGGGGEIDIPGLTGSRAVLVVHAAAGLRHCG